MSQAKCKNSIAAYTVNGVAVGKEFQIDVNWLGKNETVAAAKIMNIQRVLTYEQLVADGGAEVCVELKVGSSCAGLKEFCGGVKAKAYTVGPDVYRCTWTMVSWLVGLTACLVSQVNCAPGLCIPLCCVSAAVVEYCQFKNIDSLPSSPCTPHLQNDMTKACCPLAYNSGSGVFPPDY